MSSRPGRHGHTSSRNSERGVVRRRRSSFPPTSCCDVWRTGEFVCACRGAGATHQGRVTIMTEKTQRSFDRSRIDAVKQDLGRWLLLQAQAGVPELVLV